MAMLCYEDIFDCVFVLCSILLRNIGGNKEKVFPLRMKRMKEREREEIGNRPTFHDAHIP